MKKNLLIFSLFSLVSLSLWAAQESRKLTFRSNGDVNLEMDGRIHSQNGGFGPGLISARSFNINGSTAQFLDQVSLKGGEEHTITMPSFVTHISFESIAPQLPRRTYTLPDEKNGRRYKLPLTLIVDVEKEGEPEVTFSNSETIEEVD